jgi:SH3 domain protein
MKSVLVLFSIALSVFSAPSYANTKYITDEFDIMLRTLPAMDANIIKALPTGTPLTVVIEDAGKAHSQVRTTDGAVGYVLTRFISDKPAARSQLAGLQEQIELLRQDPDNLKSKYVDLEASYSRLSQQFRNMIDSKDAVENELDQLKEDSGNVVELSEKAKNLEKKVEQLIIQMDEMRIQNQTLKDQSEKKAWTVGAVIALVGVLLGWIFSKTGGRRRVY